MSGGGRFFQERTCAETVDRVCRMLRRFEEIRHPTHPIHADVSPEAMERFRAVPEFRLSVFGPSWRAGNAEPRLMLETRTPAWCARWLCGPFKPHIELHGLFVEAIAWQIVECICETGIAASGRGEYGVISGVGVFHPGWMDTRLCAVPVAELATKAFGDPRVVVVPRPIHFDGWTVMVDDTTRALTVDVRSTPPLAGRDRSA